MTAAPPAAASVPPTGQPPQAPPGAPSAADPPQAPPGAPADETGRLNHELSFLRQEHQQLKMQIQQFEYMNHVLRYAPAANPIHNPDWSQHRNPEDGSLYYFNKKTNESVWDKPIDFNPQLLAKPGSNQKGPRGANLFVVRKLRCFFFSVLLCARSFSAFFAYARCPSASFASARSVSTTDAASLAGVMSTTHSQMRI